VAAVLQHVVDPGAHLVVGLSGGLDSVTLLAILADLAATMRFSLRAVHVHHGISPNASNWAQFCQDLCGRLNLPLKVERVRVEDYHSLGVEGAARHARYEVYAREEADFIVLAHHRDDQAETLLLQLLRGAGPLGMAGMQELRPMAGSRARILRPLLAFARADIEAWARDRGLQWIDDESNDDTSRQRNFVRHRVLPLIEERFPAARATVARAASHLAEAGALLAELARLDLTLLDGENGLEVAGLRRLGASRAKNALRSLLQSRALAVPTAAQLDELYRQLVDAREDRAVLLKTQGWELRRYRGRICVEPSRAPVAADFRAAWTGESRLPLLQLGGVLKFKPEEGRGLSVAQLRKAEVTVRLRKGGERLQPDARRPRRTLKNLLQERGIPPWQRARWPVLYCGEDPVCVPGVGEDCAWQAGPGEPGLIVSWEALDRGKAK
jgi:tRNA(Ile)-lysidine synthase